ncbi:MAG: ABC transporter permease subunit [Armatimonadota bacterium]|nr:ABC transporter permease subunit [Armatimonadota bacterium]MDR7532044.1 ABC transporter permease subunit [Armatimonadota bacterium]MDR7535975.1 ABC transporter permease subunit [Armatimonadota bacterium]
MRPPGGRRVPEWAATLAMLLPLLALWEVVGRLEVSLFVPPLDAVARAWVDDAASGHLWRAASTSLDALVTGYGLAVTVGVPLGLAMGWSRPVQYVADLYVNTLMSAPLSALVPVLIVIFGIRETVVTATVFLFSVFIIVVNARAGTQLLDRSLVEMARAFGATEWTIFRKVALWAALPSTMVGLRLGALQAVKGMVVGEILIAITGLGERLIYYGNTFLIPHLYAVILTVLLLAVGASQLVLAVDRLVVRWK